MITRCCTPGTYFTGSDSFRFLSITSLHDAARQKPQARLGSTTLSFNVKRSSAGIDSIGARTTCWMVAPTEEEAQMTSTEIMPQARYASVHDVYTVSDSIQLGLTTDLLCRTGW